MVIAECVVVTVLIVFVWNVVAAAAAATHTAPPPLLQGAAAPTASSPAPLPDALQATKAARSVQLPGLNLSTGFWRVRLGQLNSEQVVFEQLEWRLVHSAMDAMQGYLQTVVLPSITRAERA
jgi:hypothetical protein